MRRRHNAPSPRDVLRIDDDVDAPLAEPGLRRPDAKHIRGEQRRDARGPPVRETRVRPLVLGPVGPDALPVRYSGVPRGHPAPRPTDQVQGAAGAAGLEARGALEVRRERVHAVGEAGAQRLAAGIVEGVPVGPRVVRGQVRQRSGRRRRVADARQRGEAVPVLCVRARGAARVARAVPVQVRRRRRVPERVVEPSRDGCRAVAPAGRVVVVSIVRSQLREGRGLVQGKDVQGAVVRGGSWARQERVVAVSVGPDEELRRRVRVGGIVHVEDGG